MKLFGKDIENNFIIISTLADAGEPQVLSAIKEVKIPANYVSKFNNSALFAKRDGNNAKITHLFWDIGQTGYASVLLGINFLIGIRKRKKPKKQEPKKEK